MNNNIDEIISGIENWLKLQDYNYIECNDVPECLFVRSPKINAILRTFFRMCPFNLRNMKRPDNGLYTLTPQSNVALLKAFAISNDNDLIKKIYDRVLSLRSPKTKHFALKQGIKIAISLYENSKDDPTPLNTVWFAQFLLDEHSGIIDEDEKKVLLISIATYLKEELGYRDHKEKGVYFYYGPTLKKEVYNASAIISAFYIILGRKYNIPNYIEFGERGIKYICEKQNEDGSWFYAGSPERPTIDCFHQSYILQALCSVKDFLSFDITANINKGVDFYKHRLFFRRGRYICPIRYDKRYTPRNTWLFVKVDSRDIAEALVFFSKYFPDEEYLNGLLEYTYDKFYNKKKGFIAPELFIYGKNRIPYIEFQAWFLYALYEVKNHVCENT